MWSSLASGHPITKILGAIVRETNWIKVKGSDDDWRVLLAVPHSEQSLRMRQIVQSSCGTSIMITHWHSGQHHCSAGPVKWSQVEQDAIGILFNPFIAVEGLKAACAGFLVLADSIREQQRFQFLETQNSTEEGP